MYDARTTASKVVGESVKGMFGTENTFKTCIPRNAAIGRANIARESIMNYDPKSAGAAANSALPRKS